MSTGTPRTKEGMQVSLANATAKLDKAEREIADLRKQLAEKTAECERLKALREEAFQNAGTWAAEKGDAERALAESHAREAKLREALEESRRIARETLVAQGIQMTVLCNRSFDAIIHKSAAALLASADSSALREVCIRITRAAIESRRGFDHTNAESAEAIVDRELKGML